MADSSSRDRQTSCFFRASLIRSLDSWRSFDCIRSPNPRRREHRAGIQNHSHEQPRELGVGIRSTPLPRLLEMCAIRTATLLNSASLATDLGIARATLDGYFAILERMFLVRRLPAWHSNASRRLIKAAKLHVVDTGLGAALASLSSQDLNGSREKFGSLLESWVV